MTEERPLTELLDLLAESERVRNDLGPRIRAEREKAGLTQSDLAARIGKVRSYVANVETGVHVASPTSATAMLAALSTTGGTSANTSSNVTIQQGAAEAAKQARQKDKARSD